MVRKSPKAGLREVALSANVSLATVSRALSRPEMVRDEVRERIERACRDLNYVPNRIARSLNLKRTETVGLIVPTLSNPLYAPTIDGVREALDEVGYGLFVSACERDPRREYEEARTLVAYGVDAIISMMPNHLPVLHEFLRHADVPHVFVSTGGAEQPTPHVNFDNTGAMTEIVRRVLDLGHRAIAVLSGPNDSTPVVTDRLEAAIRALAAAGCAPPPEWVVECGYEPVPARDGARRILEPGGRPTAVICTGDQQAVACIAEAQRLGIRLPSELTVTGFNDVAIAQLCEPQLATVRAPYRELGLAACRLVLSAQRGQPIPASTVLASEVVMRASAAPPAGTAAPRASRR